MVEYLETTSKIRISSKKFDATKSKLESLLSKKDLKVLSGFDESMTIDGLKASRKAKLLDSILALTKLLEGQEWVSLDTNGINSLVSKLMSRYSQDGAETNTTSDHKKALQQWFRFLKTGYRTSKDCEMELGFKHPEETRRIRINKVDDSVTFEDLVTREEKNKLMQVCDNYRDKSIIDVTDDSGVRPHELLELQIKNVKQDKYGYVLLIKKTAKTGAREVRILESTPTLAEWLNVHPLKGNPEAPLFVNTGNRNYGKAYEYASANYMLKKLCKKARIRPLHLYLFRHTETTRRMDSLNEYDNKLRHGHSKDSTAHQKYIHPTAKKADERFLIANGKEPEIKEDTLPIVCKSCSRTNSRDRGICYCGRALTVEAAVMMEKKEANKVESLQKQLNELTSTVLPLLKDLTVLRSAAKKQNGDELTTIPLKEFSKETQEQLKQRWNQK